MADPTGSAPRVVEGAPNGVALMLRAALPALPGVGALPGIRRSGGDLPDLALVRHDVPVDAAHVAAYAKVCGFPLPDPVGGPLPLTYPHLLAFGLHLAIMTDGSFPFPAVGTVHLENSITQHRPVTPAERLQVTARAQGLRPHAKGRAFDMVTTVHSRGELVWEETSTFLRRGKGDDRASAGSSFPDAPPTGTVWRLPGDLGRRYAAVSGDHNPIHLYPLTAKALGFPRQIAHGMWTAARCVAALENRLPDAVRVDVAFKKPVLLPGSVAFGSRRLGDGYAFSLSSPGSGAPHLAGRSTGL
jgi:acyl dehydratase